MCTLTESTPTWARLKSVSSIHSAEANVSLTPRLPEQETELSSSTRNWMPRLWTSETNGAILSAMPLADVSDSRLGIVANCGEVGGVGHARSG